MTSSSADFEKWTKKGLASRRRHFGDTLYCYSPTSYPYRIPDHQSTRSYNFISLSVTGESCSLQCEHCQGKLLKGMEPVLTPESLIERCQEIHERGGEGVLISGGSDSQGHVPLGRFTSAISHIKKKLELRVVVHTGLVDSETAANLASAGIDAAMLDIIGDDRVAEEIYHITDGTSKMRASMKKLREYEVPIVPHLLIGLDYGRLSGELEALHMISESDPQAVVVIALSPLRKTPMEGYSPPSPEIIGRVMTVARLGMSTIPLLLGCARPIGKHKIETDGFAVRCGVNGIAYISQEGVDLARELGLQPDFRDVCCSLAHQMIPQETS